MLSRRIIPCLDVRDGRVVKGVRFRDHVDMGDILELALRYRDEGADELVFYDITASPEGRSVDRGWVERVARVLDIPFCVAGGIRGVATARAVLHAGADKISVNTPGARTSGADRELADAFGSQCVVVGIDSDARRRRRMARAQYTGDPSQDQRAATAHAGLGGRSAGLGAGEIVLNCMGSDGVRRGYDIEQLAGGARICEVPLVASGGAGETEHFVDVFREADVEPRWPPASSTPAPSPFPRSRRYLRAQRIEVRDACMPHSTNRSTGQRRRPAARDRAGRRQRCAC